MTATTTTDLLVAGGRPTHRQLVARRLLTYGSANLAWASQWHIQLRTRILELRREGWTIETQPDGLGEGYVLIAAPGLEPVRPSLWDQP